MSLILFVCTGNYYRSRFAEIVFNHHAMINETSQRAFSRGLRLNPEKNKGAISPHTLLYLDKLDIKPESFDNPSVLSEEDLKSATTIIVMDRTEHFPMMLQKFPEWANKVEYWSFEDDYIVSPDEVLPLLKTKVEELINLLNEKSV